MRTIALILALPMLLILGGCSKQEEKEAQAVVPVQITEVRKEPIQRVIPADGILRGLDQSSVTPKISAPVSKFYVNRGDHVRQGELLATLENRDLAAAVADAKAVYEQAAANYRNVSSATVPDEVVKAQADVQAGKQQLDATKKVLDSREQLYKEGALARRLVDEALVAYTQAKSQYDTAQKHLESLQSFSRHEEVKGAAAQVDSAKAKYEAAQAQLSYSDIFISISGVVADRPLFPGEMATPGTPLVAIVDVSRVIARVNIPQGQAAYVKAGQGARVVATDGSVETYGKVTVVSPAIDPQSTTVEVWVQAPNPGERLRPGSTVHVTILADTIKDAAVVPVAALLPAEDGSTALVAVGADNIAHPRKVKVGVRNSDKAQILSGAEPGLRVVSSGGVGLEDGAKVRIEAPGGGEEKSAENDEKGSSGNQKPAADARKAGAHE